MPTQKQINNLKRLVMLARGFPGAGPDLIQQTLAQKIVLFLIEHSEGLTKDICITLRESQRGYSAADLEVTANEIRLMCEESWTTHLRELFSLTGSPLNISLRYGDFDPKRAGKKLDNSGELPSGKLAQEHPVRFTFWLAREEAYEEATLIRVTKKELEKITISREAANTLLKE